MLLAILYALLAAPQGTKLPLSKTDAAFLKRIDRAVSRMSDQKTAFVRFEKAATKADALRCRQLLPRLRPNSVYYADCAFVGAWYGLDYDANLQRITRPYRLWKTDWKRWEKEYAQDYDSRQTDMDSFYSLLNWLYLKHHDLKSLSVWEDLKLDGAPAECNDDELGELWKRHAPDMLLAAHRHPQRVKNLTGSLQFAYFAGGEKTARTRLLADLTAYSHNKDPRIARTAAAMRRYRQSEKMWGE